MGALVGGMVSLLIARQVLGRTKQDNEELAREQASLVAARDLGLALHTLFGDLEHIRGLAEDERAMVLAKAAEDFEVHVIAHAPALRQPLRTAVEAISGLLSNFGYFVYQSGLNDAGWVGSGRYVYADIQRADFIFLLGEALIAYRQGDPYDVPARPGWSWVRKYRWAWNIPWGVHVDGSGEPEPGWEQLPADERFTRQQWLDPEPYPKERPAPARRA